MPYSRMLIFKEPLRLNDKFEKSQTYHTYMDGGGVQSHLNQYERLKWG